MSDGVRVSVGKIRIVGAEFPEDKRGVRANPIAENEIQSIVEEFYTVLKKRGFHGHISIRYTKEVGTKIGTY